MEIEPGTFTHLAFTTTGGMADECIKYHSKLAELIANKKGESYSSAVSWIRAKVSFATQDPEVDSDLQIENVRACPS